MNPNTLHAYIRKEELLPSLVEKGLSELGSSSLPVIFYGAGIYAKRIFNYLKNFDIYPDCALVDDDFPEGEFFLSADYKIDKLHLDKILLKFNQPFNIINAHQNPAKTRSLSETLPQIANCYEFEEAVFPLWSWQFLENNMDAFEESFEMFADSLSRETFINFIRQKISGNFIYSQKVIQDAIYIPKNIIKLNNEDVIVDGGAFTGDTVKYFTENLDGFERILCFEPDPYNFKILCNNVKKYENIDCYNIGLADIDKQISFSTNEAASSTFSKIGGG